MKRLRWIACALFVAAISTSAAQTSFGKAEKFNDGWRFILGDSTIFATVEYADTAWRELSLPHDWSIEQWASPTLNSCTGYYPGGVAWYRKDFTLPVASAPKQYLYFEGVYNRSDVYVNGHLLGHRPNGYVSFAYDITPYLNPAGEANVVAVRVDHSREADSRYYTGSGIYRNVYLVGADNAHFDLWGVGYRADNVSSKSADITIDVRAVDENTSKGNLSVVAEILDLNDNIVATGKQKIKGGEKEFLKLKLRKPHLWDINDPYLYTLRTKLLRDGRQVDQATTTMGVRQLEFDANTGFALNGRNMKVKGVCLHSSGGAFGAAVPKAVWRTRLENLKKMGANAIRTSHNMHAPMVYDLCDEIGLLVMDEASDEWEFPKRKWVKGWNVGTPKFEGSFDFFNEWIDRDITDMVRRDRNHPSVFLWSIGNEVDYPNDPYSHPVLNGGNAEFTQPIFGGYNPDAPNAERIGKIAKRLSAEIKKVDTSRPTTGALAGVVMSNQTEYPEAVDVVGYNYTESRYATDHATYPERVIYGSENRHDYPAWQAVRDTPYIFGQFIWTGVDYLGESGRWPSRGLGTGLLGFDNMPKGRGRFRHSLWAEDPVAHLGAYRKFPGPWGEHISIDAADVWNFDPGQQTMVVCYTNGESARLKLNGEDLGVRQMPDSIGIISWSVPFSPGELTVEVFDNAGSVIATDTLTTSNRPYALRATPLHNYDGIAQVLVEVIDENEVVVKLADNEISCMVGDNPFGRWMRHRQRRDSSERIDEIRLLAFESANNQDMSSHRDDRERVYEGRAIAYFSLPDGAKPSKATFTSPLLKPCTIELGK